MGHQHSTKKDLRTKLLMNELVTSYCIYVAARDVVHLHFFEAIMLRSILGKKVCK